MPSKIKISKEDILKAALQIARKEGIDKANVREIAKKLNCSVQPIYYQFKNMENLKIELIKEIKKTFYEFLTKNMTDTMPVYKQVGINYIKFAKKEPMLFKILFMTKTDLIPESFVEKDNENYREIEKYVKISTKLNDNDLKEFHIRMWVFTHGIATLVASNTCKLTDEQISQLLSYEFQALMLLEENPDNKWVLKNSKFKSKDGDKDNRNKKL